MALKGKYKSGETWSLPEGSFIYLMETSDGRMLFERERVADNQAGETLLRGEDEIERLLAAGKASRQRHFRKPDGSVKKKDRAGEIGPDGPSEYGRTLRHYVTAFDAAPCGKGTKALDAFVARNAADAEKLGPKWRPSAGALRRAIAHCGVPNRRPRRVFESQRGKTPRQHWPATVAALLEDAVDWYYSLRERDAYDAHGWLAGEIAGRKANGEPDLPTPSYETLRVRIRAGETLERLTAKLGEREARLKWKATKRGAVAKGILDIVMIDATVLDDWCAIDDRHGRLIPAGRPTVTVALDLWSRCVLGVTITYSGETLSAVMACLQQVVSGKHAIIDRLPHYKEILADLHGKPDTIVVDNAWRQTGVSFQDACEDAGINVEWAAVRNPEWKAHVETFWRTLNKLLVHKLPGSVSLPAQMLRAFDYDPAKTACLTITQLEELVYQAITQVYHERPHSGTLLHPILAWREGLAQGREIIDDIDFLAAAFGTVSWATLDRQGITYRNCRFHDPVVTEELLADLAPHTPVRSRRRRGSSAVARVKIKVNPDDATAIQVWNPKQKPTARYRRLPNWDQGYASLPGFDFELNDRIRRWADTMNLAFKTDEERIIARDKLRQATEDADPEGTLRARRAFARLKESRQPVLKAGDTVEFRDTRPGVAAHRPYDIAAAPIAPEREDGGIPRKGPQRGKRKAGPPALRPAASPVAAEQSPIEQKPSRAAVPAADARAVMDEMMRRMAAKP